MLHLSFVDWIAIALILLTALKGLEMKYHKRLVDRGVADTWKALPATRLLHRVPVLHWMLFKLPTQILGLTVVGFLTRNAVISWLVAASLGAILWFLMGRMMYDLLRQGTNRHLTSIGVAQFTIAARPDLGPRERIRSFVIAIIAYVSQIVLGYASIFYICHTQFRRTAFAGIPDDGYEFFYFIYYSLVTFGTVGYGDISPANLTTTPVCESPLVRILTRLFVGSEICLSFVVVAVFIASFSLAFGHESEERK